MKFRHGWSLGLLGAIIASAAEPANPAPPAPKAITADEVFQTGKDLFDTFAPAEIKAQFEFPDKVQWDDFMHRLQLALANNDLAALAQYEFEARAALVALRSLPGNEENSGWLEERLDFIEAAKLASQSPVPKPVPPPANTDHPGQFIPHYDLWVTRLQARPKPVGADRYMPLLGPIFVAAGLPSELAWLAEVESTFNPAAGSPAGARGLFQIMPETAKELGLSTLLDDERTDPEKSAGAASQLLTKLYKRFGDWPLALAAYNAGPGRVRRTLNQQKATTFAEIAASLPAETRMYVPKVLAMLQVRAGMSLAGLAPPRM